MVDEEKYTLNTSQKGHWYKCKNAKCELRIPLPDKINETVLSVKSFLDQEIKEKQWVDLQQSLRVLFEGKNERI
jgi:hypothetical protein